MGSTYSVGEGQVKLPFLVREGRDQVIRIIRSKKTVGYLVPTTRMEAIAETLEIMADGEAMHALRKAARGRGKYFPISALANG